MSNMKLKSKRGVSPIIATVLLVAITIAIGATTMAFIRSLSDTNLNAANEKAATISCGTDVSLELASADNKYLHWHNVNTTNNDSEFIITFHNKGLPIDGFRFTVISKEGVIKQSNYGYPSVGNGYPFERDTYQTFRFYLYNGDNSSDPLVGQELDRFILEPKIRSQGKGMVLCTDSTFEYSADTVLDSTDR